MKKIIISIIFFLVLIGIVIGIVGNINNFNGQTNPFDVNFTTAQNKTYYIDLPIYSKVSNVTINLEGLEAS